MLTIPISMRAIVPYYLLLIVLILAPDSARGQIWYGMGVGARFDDPANWNLLDYYPRENDTAQFGNPTGSYLVNADFGTGISIAGMRVYQGSPQLFLGPTHPFTVSGQNGFAVGYFPNATANLQINGGTFTLSQDNDSIAPASPAGIGSFSNSTGNVTVTGSATKFIALKSLGIGISGTGTLTIQNGASASLGDFTFVGENSTGNGTINVTGPGSALSMGNHVIFGEHGSGTLSIGGGASATIGDGLMVGFSAGSSVNVNTGGTLTFVGSALFGEGIDSFGSLDVNAGGTLKANGNLYIETGSDAALNGTWNQNGGLITVYGVMSLNDGSLTATTIGGGINISNGYLAINGGDHTVRNLTRSGTGAISMAGGVLTVGNGGTFDNGNSDFSVGGTNSSAFYLANGAHTTGLRDLYVDGSVSGYVDVVGGSVLNATSLKVGYDKPVGIIGVDGSNSRINLSGGGTSYIGDHGIGVLTINGDGTTVLDTGGGTLISAGESGSTGYITVNGGWLDLGNGGDLHIGYKGAGSIVTHNDGIVTIAGNASFGGRAGGYGAAVLDTGATWTVGGRIGVGGTVDAGSGGQGALSVQSGGALLVTQDIVIFPGGVVSLEGGFIKADSISLQGSGGQFNFTSGSLSVKTFNGSLANEGGDFSVTGDSGVNTIKGDYTQQSAATLDVYVSGATPGSGYGQLNVTGKLSLAGTLHVEVSASLVNGETFDILNWGSLSGAFGVIDLPTLSNGLAWNTLRLYSEGILSVVGPPVAGDYNDDGFVDAADYTVWRDSLGKSGSGLAADGDRNGIVDQADYTIWKANFGTPAGRGAEESSIVPEPSAIALVAMASLLLAATPRRSLLRRGYFELSKNLSRDWIAAF